jgi:hypothetical protein
MVEIVLLCFGRAAELGCDIGEVVVTSFSKLSCVLDGWMVGGNVRVGNVYEGANDNRGWTSE